MQHVVSPCILVLEVYGFEGSTLERVTRPDSIAWYFEIQLTVHLFVDCFWYSVEVVAIEVGGTLLGEHVGPSETRARMWFLLSQLQIHIVDTILVVYLKFIGLNIANRHTIITTQTIVFTVRKGVFG